MLEYHSRQSDGILASDDCANSQSVLLPNKTISHKSEEEWISGSAIALALTEKWLCEIEDPDAIAVLLNWNYYCHSGGWFVKSVNPTTGKYAKHGQFKPSSPLEIEGKTQKYISFPKGKGTQPIFAPMTLDLWINISERHGVAIANEDIDESREDLGFWLWVIAHPELPINITEGAKKAGCLLSKGEVAIALTGVWNGQIGKGKNLHPALIPFITPGRCVRLAFDADATVKPQVEAALIQFGRLCKQQKAEVFIVLWELQWGKGIDDLLVSQGEEKFRETIGNAIAYRGWLQSLEAQVRQSPSSDDKKTKKPPTPDLIARELREKYLDKWLWDNEHKTWQEYERKQKGVWNPVDDLYISVQINLILQTRGIEGYGESYLNNIVGMLRRELYCHEWNEKKNLLPFLDGVLESDTGKFLEHSPGHRLTWVLPRNYTLLDRSWNKIERWLEEAVGGDVKQKKLILCYAAAILRRRSDLQKFLHIIGLGGSGKSTLINLLVAVVGEQNTLSLDLDTLNEKDAIADILGKVLLVFPDQDSCGKQVSNFKKITGQDLLRGRKLYKDAFNFRFEGMVAISSNQPIFHAGSGRWLTRRALMVPFKQIIPDHRIRDLEKDFESELSAFTHYLLSIPESEIEAVLRGVQDKQKISLTLWEAQIRSDGLASWVNEHLIFDPLAKTQIGSNAREWLDCEYNPTQSTLFGSYCWFGRQTLRSPLTKENFSANLLELLTATLGWQVEKRKSNGVMVISGVRLRTATDGDRLTVEEQLQGGLSGEGGGESQGDLKALLDMAQGEQGGLSSQISYLEHSGLENLETSISSPLEKEPENIQGIEEADVSLVSLTHIGQGFHPSLESVDSPSPELSLDFSTYPHRTSDDIRAKENRASKCRELMLGCTNFDELALFKDESGFSENEIKWVYKHLLSPSEKEAVRQAAIAEQLTLSVTENLQPDSFERGDLVYYLDNRNVVYTYLGSDAHTGSVLIQDSQGHTYSCQISQLSKLS